MRMKLWVFWLLCLRLVSPIQGHGPWTTITYDNFALGWGNYTNLGSADWVAKSLRMQHQSGVVLTDFVNVQGFEDLRVRFWYYADSMVNNNPNDPDMFVLEFLDHPEGIWQLVRQYVAGRDFENHQHERTFVEFSQEGVFAMTDQAKIRFRCDATNQKDYLYIDEIWFEGLPRDVVPHAEPSQSPSGRPSLRPSSMPSIAATLAPSTDPTNVPTTLPSFVSSHAPSDIPSAVPSTMPSSAATTFEPTTPIDTSSPTTFLEGTCPRGRRYPPEKYLITPFTDTNPNDGVEDDLYEVSYVAYSTQTDANGNRYAYMASDKEQFSLKVVQFQRNTLDSGTYWDGDGETVATYTLFTEEPDTADWEDISLGPCTDVNTTAYTTDQVCIYVADTGNNARPNKTQRKELDVYKFVEPDIGASGPISQVVPFATIEYFYGGLFDQSEDQYYDAEAMFVDWVGVNGDANENMGDIYVVTKSGCNGGVGKIPVEYHRDLAPGEVLSNLAMEKVVGYPPHQGEITCVDNPYRPWSGADMSRHGQLIAMIREGPPSSAYFFPRTSSQSVAEALSLKPCDYIASISIGLTSEIKFEAVGFVDPDARKFATISECGGVCSPPLYQYELEYMDSHFSVIEGPVEGWDTFSYDTFEDNTWGNWTSGGSQAVLSKAVDNRGGNTCGGSCTCEGDWAVQLSNDLGAASSVYHGVSYACDEYSLLRVTFQFKFRGYDHLDTLFLEISLDGGLTYFIVGDWAHSVSELPNYTDPLGRAVCYGGKVTVAPKDFRVQKFGNQVKVRFRNSANGSADFVYIDSIHFEGYSVESTVE